MKKIVYNYSLITVLCATITHNAIGTPVAAKIAKLGISGLCSLIELGTTSTPLIVAGILHPRDLLKAQKENTAQSNAPQIIIDHITQLAKERNIKHEIKVVVQEDDQTPYSMDSNNHIVLITSEKAEELKSLLNNTNHNESEQKTFNWHNAAIHHELTHDINKDVKRKPIYEAAVGTLGSIGASAIFTDIIKKYIPEIKKKFTLHNSFKLARTGLTYTVAFNLIQMNIGSKYAELKADDGIPNKKELLEAFVEGFENDHAHELENIETFQKNWPYQYLFYHPLDSNMSQNRIHYLVVKTLPKNWFNNPLVMDTIRYTNSTHLSPIHRAKRVRKKIAKLEKQEKQTALQDQLLNSETQQ